jgi:hypothetical protein
MKSLQNLLLFSALMLSLLMFSCKEDLPPDPDPNPNTTLDGLFVYGTNTVATEAGSPASKVELAVLDPGKGAMVDDVPGIYGKFLHIGANGSLQLTFAEDQVATQYGTSGGGSLDSATSVGGSVNDLVIHGSLVENADPIQVTNEGLYYLYVDMNRKKFILMEVKANIIGDATDLQWDAGTPLALKSSDTLQTVFEATGINLVGASGYRYRFNDGWHVFDDDQIVTLSSLGVPDYAAAWSTGINEIGYYLDNAPQKESGIFTITLTYDAKTATWSETKTKTGDPLRDYSNVKFGLFGNAYYVMDSVEGAWDAIHHSKLPTQDNTNAYTWTWTQELIQNRSFVLREDATDGVWITYSETQRTGSAFTDDSIIQEAGQDNFFVVTGGTYTITFTINANDGSRELRIEP